jgi:ribosome-binding factor A
MRKTRRTSKVGQMIRDALVEVFRFDLKHVNIGMASITDVEISPDLHFARVFISGFKEDETLRVIEELQNARGRIRGFLGKRIRLRYTPELDFKFDETSARAGRIEDLLAKSHDDDKSDDNSES